MTKPGDSVAISTELEQGIAALLQKKKKKKKKEEGRRMNLSTILLLLLLLLLLSHKRRRVQNPDTETLKSEISFAGIEV
jgi:hypothetical protein